jgi:peptidyl-prolyl cis-trans isomerase D
MMREMRAHMKWIMAVTAVTFVALMVFGWGMDITGRSGMAATGGELGRVNGEPIAYEEWDVVRRNLYEQQQRMTNARPNAAVDKQIADLAWDQVIAQKLVGQELKRRGIGVSDAEVQEMARVSPPQEFVANPMFQTNGQFDPAKYQAFLSTPGNSELLLKLEAYYRDVIPRSKLFFQTTAGSYMPDSELWRMWQDAREKVRVRYIFFDPSTLIGDSRVTVSPREIERYYNENKEDFQRPAHAKVRYVTIDRTPNAADTASALARVQRIRQEIVSGAKFEDLAKQESADSVSRAEGGKLGKLRKGQGVAPAFENALFTLPLNKISEPVQTQYGFHLIEVQSRTDDEAEARHILVPIQPTTERDDTLLALADSLDDLGSEGSLAKAAQALNLTVRTAELEPNLTFLPAVGQADEGAVWVFDEGQVGEVSSVMEAPNAFYMIELVERTDAGQQSLSEATPAIRARLIQDKKLAATREIARRATDVVRGGGSLDQAAQAVGLKLQEAGPFTRLELVPGLGQANPAIGTAFGLKPNQVSDVVEAEGALFLIQTVEKTPADRQEFEKQKVIQRAQMSRALSEQRWKQYMQALRENAKIVDNRAKMLQRPGATTTNQ